MMLRHVAPLFAVLPLLGFAACGGSTSSSGPTQTQDTAGNDAGSTDDTVDAAPNTGPDPIDPSYPTAHPALPQVDYNGGPVLHAPHIITVTVVGDAQQAQLEQFSSIITTSAWWDTVSNGYCDSSGGCVGHGDAGTPVHLPTTAFTTTSFTDSSQGGAATLQDFITSLISAGTFPAPTPDTLYAIYFPDSSYTVNLDGSDSCSSFGGYHNSYNYPGNGTIPAGNVQYSVVPRCDSSIDTTTVAASHEYIEAATDPEVGSGTAYYMQDQLWALEGGEVGDLCESGKGTSTTESGFTVQRIWSNIAAKASHDPCVPAPAGDVYFNVAPKSEQTRAKVGDTVTFALTAFSDAPTDDWAISGRDLGAAFGGTSSLTFAFDKTTVNNGTKINMSVTVTAAPPAEFGGAALFQITSKGGTTSRKWPGAIIVEQ